MEPIRPTARSNVVANKIPLTGVELATKTASGVLYKTQPNDSPDSPNDCGHPPNADVTYSVRNASSLRQFLQHNGDDPTLGVRHLGTPGSPISLNGLMGL